MGIVELATRHSTDEQLALKLNECHYFPAVNQ